MDNMDKVDRPGERDMAKKRIPDDEFMEVKDGDRTWIQRRKTGPHLLNRLAAGQLAKLPQGRHHDGGGLYLQVVGGSRVWVQRITFSGKVRQIGHGPFPLVSLQDARRRAFETKQAVRDGRDPLAERRGSEQPLTFGEAVSRVIDLNRPSWKNAKHAAQWLSTLETYAFPRLAKRPVDSITTTDILAVLTDGDLWHEKAETARRLRQRLNTVFKWALANGHRPDNPAGDALTAALPRQRAKAEHFKALPYADVPAMLKRVKESNAAPHTALCLELVTLTACRSGEARGATWPEFDVEARTWTIPADRMKAGVEHRVPLSDGAIDVVRRTADLKSSPDLLFPGPTTGRPLSDSTLSKLLRDLKVPGTVHGLRSSFADWANERTRASRQTVEAALAHTVRDKAEAAYSRTDLLEKRRTLMDAWAAFLNTETANIVRIA